MPIRGFSCKDEKNKHQIFPDPDRFLLQEGRLGTEDSGYSGWKDSAGAKKQLRCQLQFLEGKLAPGSLCYESTTDLDPRIRFVEKRIRKNNSFFLITQKIIYYFIY